MATCTITCQYVYPDLLEEVKFISLQREDQSRETLRMEWIVWSSTRAGYPGWHWPNLILGSNMQLWQLMLTDTSLAGFKLGSLWNQTLSRVWLHAEEQCKRQLHPHCGHRHAPCDLLRIIPREAGQGKEVNQNIQGSLDHLSSHKNNIHIWQDLENFPFL